MSTNSYDDYGQPATTNLGRFQYTGQAWIPEFGSYYYRARQYHPTLGRFLQPDPIGFEGGINLYAYVNGDPINLTDPLGLIPPPNPCPNPEDICVIGAPTTTVLIGPARPTLARLENNLAIDGGAEQRGTLCPTTSKSVAGTIADYADKIGLAADAATAASITAGLATAPTGAGPAAAGVAAVTSKAVGSAANLVGLVANIVDGNYAGALSNGVAVFAGNKVGHLATRVLTRGRAFGTLTAQGQRVAQGLNTGTSLSVQLGVNVACGGN